MGYNQWCPISFDGKTPYFNSLGSWDLNAKTGKWSVAADNDYVKNASFEADRKRVPSTVKPVQQQLSGWYSTVIEGNPLTLDAASPALNHDNNESDRKVAIGEKSLNISDRIAFKRKVSQTISSTPYVKLADGFYTLTAKVKNSGGFARLEMYANSSSAMLTYGIKEENTAWRTIALERVRVKDGKVEIGFVAEGAANAFCFIDDVSLLKTR